MSAGHLGITAEALLPLVPVGVGVFDGLAEQRLVVGGRVGRAGLAPSAVALLGVPGQLRARLPLLLLPSRPLLALRPLPCLQCREGKVVFLSSQILTIY